MHAAVAGRILVLTSLTAALPIVFGGCPSVGDIVNDLVPGTPAIRPVGSAKDALLLSKLDGPSLAATRTVCEIDLGTGVSREIVSGIATMPEQVVASDEYVAWVDANGGTVLAYEIRSGQTATIFSALVGEVQVLGIVGDVLIVHRSSGGLLNEEWQYRLIDLGTTDTTTIDTSWQFGTFAYDGRWFALLNDEDVTAEPQSLELIANLDLIDTRTGDRVRLAENIRVDGDGGALFLDDGLLIWEEFTGEDFTTTVMAYDLDADTISTLVDDFDGDLRGVRDGQLLSVNTRGNPLVLESRSIDLYDPSLQQERIVTYTFTVGDGQTFSMLPRQIGDVVVWIDPFTGEIVTFDTQSGQTGRITP